MRSQTRGRALSPTVIIGMLAAALTLTATSTAQANSIVFIGSDGNVHLTTPDGSRSYQVTDDATAPDSYSGPAQGPDGLIYVGTDSGGIMVFEPDGTFKRAMITQADFAGPFNLDISPDGTRIVYDYLYDPPFDAPIFYSETMSTTASDTGGCESQCLGNYVEPRWIPGAGTSDFLGIADTKDSIAALSNNFGDSWIESAGDEFESFDLSPTGNDRALLQFAPPGSTAGTLVLFQNDGQPPARGAAEDEICQAPLGNESSNPRWSPDAASFTWHDGQGVWVSPAPTGGPTCSVAPKLVAAGGKEPDWGPAEVPLGGDDGGDGGGSDGGGGAGGGDAGGGGGGDDGSADDGSNDASVNQAACKQAKKKLKKAKRKLKKLKADDAKERAIDRAKKKVRKAKKHKKKKCAPRS